MKKQYDEFTKMKVKEMSKAIEDMTYTYVNPETKKPTEVPAKHYESILNRAIEEFLDDTLRVEILNVVYKQFENLEKENLNDFIQSMICLDKGLKPTNLNTAQKIAIQGTLSYILEKKITAKKGFHYLDQEYLDKFDELMKDKELHSRIIGGNSWDEDNDMDDEDDLEPMSFS